MISNIAIARYFRLIYIVLAAGTDWTVLFAVFSLTSFQMVVTVFANAIYLLKMT